MPKKQDKHLPYFFLGATPSFNYFQFSGFPAVCLFDNPQWIPLSTYLLSSKPIQRSLMAHNLLYEETLPTVGL